MITCRITRRVMAESWRPWRKGGRLKPGRPGTVILAYAFDDLVLKLAQLRDLKEIHAQREADCGGTAED